MLYEVITKEESSACELKRLLNYKWHQCSFAAVANAVENLNDELLQGEITDQQMAEMAETARIPLIQANKEDTEKGANYRWCTTACFV